MTIQKVLVVDDESGIRDMLRLALETADFECLEAGNIADAYQKIIDGFLVNGSAKVVAKMGTRLRRIQTGFISHYAFIMILGAFTLVTIWLFGK